MTAVKAAYEAADELRFAPGVDREKVADAFREALKLAVASTAALAILAGVPAQEDDEELVSSFVKAWQKSEGRFAVRALLLSAMTTSRA